MTVYVTSLEVEIRYVGETNVYRKFNRKQSNCANYLIMLNYNYNCNELLVRIQCDNPIKHIYDHDALAYLAHRKLIMKFNLTETTL